MKNISVLAILLLLNFANAAVTGSTDTPFSESACESSIMCGNCLTQCRAIEKTKYFSYEPGQCTCTDSIDSNSIGPTDNPCFNELLAGEEGKAVPIDNANGNTKTLAEIYGAKGTEAWQKENGTFNPKSSLGNKVSDIIARDSFGGRTMRKILNWSVAWGGIPEIYTYEEPKTEEFFSKVDSIEGTQSEIIRETYGLAAAAVPNYRQPGEETINLSFEQVLEGKTALCREQATLLNSALQRKGIDSKVVFSEGHAWVRVTMSQPDSACDGETFDLDPTWYKSFVPIERRN